MEFPLQLSCGHTTRLSLDDVGCECHSGERKYNNNSNEPSSVDKAHDQFHGSWQTVLSNYGCQLPSGRKHGPCPVCGGKDRFRFDDKNGRGTWYCSQCEPSSGGGLLLLSRFIGKSVMETAKELIGDDVNKTIAPKRVHVVNHDEVRAKNIEQAKIGAKSLMASAVAGGHEYMDNKGLDGEWLVNGEAIYSKQGIIPKGDLLLVPVYKKCELVNVQKITKDGEKRPLFGGDMQGVQHIVSGKEKSIAVVEGYATGITINKLTGFKTYVAFNTGNLESAVKQVKLDHPNANIIVFGDHDKIDPAHNRRPGEYYANKAADPFAAKVALPPELGDWDDYRQKHGDDECKAAMRLAIGIKPKQVKPVEEPTKAPKEAPPAQSAQPQKQAPTFGSWMGGNTDNKQQPKKPTGINALPEGVSLDGVDVDSPPGLAGEIVKYMQSGAHRKLQGGAFSAMAIQCMAMAGSGLRGFRNSKLSLITITLGVSASGKDRAQAVSKNLLGESGINVYGDIRSDKDVIRAAAYDDGRCFYIKDEAHTLLGDSLGGKDKNTSKIPAVLMEIATSSLYILSKLHAEEFEGTLGSKKARYEKMILAKEDIRLGFNTELEKAKIKHIDHEIVKLKEKVAEVDRVSYAIEHGVKDPALNLAALSTPQKLSGIIDEDSIESGFLGRALIFDCGVERVQNDSLKDFDKWEENGYETQADKALYERLKAEVGMIVQSSLDARNDHIESAFTGRSTKTIATPEASRMMFDIAVHYDKQEYLNHPRLGALYARLSERVMSVSSSLALYNVIDGNVTIEVEHVKYALLVALNSIKHLESNLRINEAKDGETVESKLEGIKEAITKRLDVNKDDPDEGWRYKSKVKSNIKRQNFYQDIAKELVKHNQDPFENAVMSLRGEGKIEIDGVKMRLKQK
ncbi:hypothetical protein MAELSTROM_59 [Pseudoalteromonas phage Maelstrom]|uniref:hypothetical protein n=1 Tax=Pseudoalteromonas phage Maelstrom TaxID=2065202 RepID=UPI000CA1CFF8|nr:hypothetical protein PP584_gp59 [Pseudoalteromonas phage Maelstrom]AUG84978.1 hypothetical protein MAELSTROM_59 [Pseudoalteromonas phage Maelstrom]